LADHYRLYGEALLELVKNQADPFGGMIKQSVEDKAEKLFAEADDGEDVDDEESGDEEGADEGEKKEGEENPAEEKKEDAKNNNDAEGDEDDEEGDEDDGEEGDEDGDEEGKSVEHPSLACACTNRCYCSSSRRPRAIARNRLGVP
jgi:hypothetical protein